MHGGKTSGRVLQYMQFLKEGGFNYGNVQMFRDAKKHLPRPKVGDFCTRAMEDGFKDACYALCQNEKPVPRIAQACRAAAIELPRPTVRKWCEHGYRKGYAGTIEGLKNYFQDGSPASGAAEEEVAEPVVTEEAKPVKEEQQHHHREENPGRVITKTIQITLDEETKDLNVHEGQSAEEAVAEFCELSMPEEIPSCIRQLLPIVLERMEE